MYSIGCAHIYIMTAISIERYMAVFKPAFIKTITNKTTFKSIAFCLMLSLFWSVMPFFGWSYYTLEGGLTSCTVEWASRELNVYSYNISVWIFAFVLPFTIIIYCNINMLLIVILLQSCDIKSKGFILPCRVLK